MFNKSTTHYNNFVRPTSPTHPRLKTALQSLVTGEEAKKLYLEEVGNVSGGSSDHPKVQNKKTKLKRRRDEPVLSDKDLFLSAQNDEVETLRQILDSSPDKINAVDDYGWSLLMIACQANSIETVKELLKRDIDMFIRDKAGNSARSLVIKNKNLVLADILIDHKNKSLKSKHEQFNLKKVKLKQEFVCDICNNKTFLDKEEHLSSTLHNINASKGRKIPSNYVIPESNRGYQLMLKVGWDRDSGLGPDGSGKKYPIKTVQKKDRKGLGHEKKRKQESTQETVKNVNKKTFQRDYYDNRKMEINFRREFY